MKHPRRLLRDQRGTASVEAAVMLPVMILCWVGLLYRFHSLEKYLDAAVEARRDAWVFSGQGCEGGHEPSGMAVNCDVSNSDGTGWMDVIHRIPFVGFLVSSIWGFKLTKTAEREQPRPGLFGGGVSKPAYSYSLMCNELEREPLYVLQTCICQQVEALGLSLSFAMDCPDPPARLAKNCP